MNKIKVLLYVNALAHNRQIIAGFRMLEASGLIDLKVVNDYKLPNAFAKAIINNKTIIYDTRDGGNKESYFDSELLQCDIYYKRSFNKIVAENKSLKIRPFGFNYMTDYDMKYIPIKYRVKEKIQSYINPYANVSQNYSFFECEPKVSANEIIFITRLWDYDINDKETLDEKKEINEFRVECILKSKKEFGDKIITGISNSKLANEYYKDLIISRNITKKENFIKTLHNSNICIATTGIRKSIGWRMGEYIAASKAIVTEKLHYDVSGNFEKEKNYLEFNTSDQLIENIYKLIDNKEKMIDMMNANRKYYISYLRPDSLILNTIKDII